MFVGVGLDVDVLVGVGLGVLVDVDVGLDCGVEVTEAVGVAVLVCDGVGVGASGFLPIGDKQGLPMTGPKLEAIGETESKTIV